MTPRGYSHIVAYQATKFHLVLCTRSVSSKSDIVANAADGLTYGRGIGHMELQRDITGICTGVVTTQVDGDGAGDEDVCGSRRRFGYARLRRCRRSMGDLTEGLRISTYHQI